jgi:hypothetical protein
MICVPPLWGDAFLIMDYGSKHGTGLHLSVYGFSNSDVDKLMFTLQDKFKFRYSIHLYLLIVGGPRARGGDKIYLELRRFSGST